MTAPKDLGSIKRTMQIILSGDYATFFLIAGPCAVENEAMCFEICEEAALICSDLSIPYIFKASFRKANRTRHDSFRGIGDRKAKEILKKIRSTLGIPVTTDVHEVKDLHEIETFCDMIQIPAFLSRQTDLISAAAQTGLPVNIKKGQFMNANTGRFALLKITRTGNMGALITERGSMYGYEDLVVDYRNIARLKSDAVAVIMDCTHSGQRPNTGSGVTGGSSSDVEMFARLGLTAGARGLFMEVHPEPSKALSDAQNAVELAELEGILKRLSAFGEAIAPFI